MSDSQTAWTILWNYALTSLPALTPFEIAEVAPTVALALKVSTEEATRLVGDLLAELDRLPDGTQYFTREGNAVVPLPGFAKAAQDPKAALSTYPYEQ